MSGLDAKLHGVVLAGGESRRMGRDKAWLDVRGELLWQRQMGVLHDAGAVSVAIVRRPGQPGFGHGVLQVRDRFPNAGPLAGLHAALFATSASHVAVLAVDMPEIDAKWFRWLAGFCRPAVGAIARHRDGCEPLAAIYPREALIPMTRRLRDNRFSLQALATELAQTQRVMLVPLPESERWRVRNCNFPGDLRARA
jgi:molybdopterin-guanine dinucleotide biosynthesis protein A